MKEVIKIESQKSGWAMNLRSRLANNRVKLYHTWIKSKARMILLWRIGSLRFKDSWHDYNQKGDGVGCISRFCKENDSLRQAVQCRFMRVNYRYKIKLEDIQQDSEELAEYLIELNKERTKRFRCPLM